MYFIRTIWILLFFISGFAHLVQCGHHGKDEGDADTNPPDGSPVAVAIQPNRNVDDFVNAQPNIPTSWTEWSNVGTCEGRCDTSYMLQRRHCVFATALPIDISLLQPQCVGNGVRIKECQLVSCFALEHPDLAPEQYTTYFLEKAISVVNSYKELTTRRKKITKVLTKKDVNPDHFLSGINLHLTELRKKMNKKVIKKLRKQLGNELKFAKITVAVSNSQINILNGLSSAVIEASSSVMQVVSSGKKPIRGEFTKMGETISNVIHAAEDVIEEVVFKVKGANSQNFIEKVNTFVNWKTDFVDNELQAISDIKDEKHKDARDKLVSDIKNCLDETMNTETKETLKKEKKKACNEYIYKEFNKSLKKLIEIERLLGEYLATVKETQQVKDAQKKNRDKIRDLLVCQKLFLKKDKALLKEQDDEGLEDSKLVAESIKYLIREFPFLKAFVIDAISAFQEWYFKTGQIKDTGGYNDAPIYLSLILEKLGNFQEAIDEIPKDKAEKMCELLDCIEKQLEQLELVIKFWQEFARLGSLEECLTEIAENMTVAVDGIREEKDKMEDIAMEIKKVK